MNLSNSPVMELSKAKMRYLGQRQSVLALNIANVDTADYKARDVKEPNFAAMVGNQAIAHEKMLRTHAMHMLPTNQRGAFEAIERKSMDERNPNDNRVNIDEEVQKVAFTQSEYNKVIGIYRKNISMYRMALGNQGGV
jgi:flagellar basal-body rod protein FlgB